MPAQDVVAYTVTWHDIGAAIALGGLGWIGWSVRRTFMKVDRLMTRVARIEGKLNIDPGDDVA